MSDNPFFEGIEEYTRTAYTPEPSPQNEELAYCASVVDAMLEQAQAWRDGVLEVTGNPRHFLVRELEVTISKFMLHQVGIGFLREGGEPRER